MTTPDERPDLDPAAPASPETPAFAPVSAPAPLESAHAGPAAARPEATGGELKSRIESGARAFDQRAQALGREAETAVTRWGENPAVKETADIAGRVWGLVLLAVGLWFLADVTLKLDLPSFAWRDLWPIALIALGAIVVLRGLMRRA